MALGTLTGTTVDLVIPPKVGATDLLIQNLITGTATLIVHQGFVLDGSNNPIDTNAAQVAPGESIRVGASRTTFVNSVSNVAGTFLFTHFV
jgi:hypothetical protein